MFNVDNTVGYKLRSVINKFPAHEHIPAHAAGDWLLVTARSGCQPLWSAVANLIICRFFRQNSTVDSVQSMLQT